MKQLRNLLLIIPVILGVISCNTDDLKNDIDSLKDRVTNLEAQVLLLNENLNSLRVLVEGNKTIQSYVYNEETDKYTVKLSDGSEIVLTQGTKGEATTPSISISEDGYWVINGEKQDTKAEGTDAATPKFRINSEGYWQVDLDGEDGPGTFENVLDQNGAPVKASTDQSISMSDEFFESVKEENGCLVVTLKDGGKTYSLPIVEDLICEIVDPEEGFKDGVLTVGYGQSVELTVKVKGDNYAVTAPAGWTAVLGEPDAETNEAKLSLVAPAATALSRATADNTRDLTLQVNSGINWAIDKIQVVAEEVIESYYSLYEAGETLNLISGLSINKETYGEAQLVNSNDFEFTTDYKVYFIDPSVDLNWTSTINFPNLILIGNSSAVKSKITPTKQIKISNEDSNGIFVSYNLEINTENVMNNDGSAKTYLLAQNGNTSFGTVIFNNTDLICLAGQALTYISPNNRSIENLVVENCKFAYDKGTQQQWVVSVGSSTATYGTLKFKNNIFYCKELGLTSNFKLYNGNKSSIKKVIIENNSFINLGTVNGSSTTGVIYAENLTEAEISKNIFYAKDGSADYNYMVFRITNPISQGINNDNIAYRNDGTTRLWQMFYSSGGISCAWEDAGDMQKITDNPFEGGKFDPATGTFVPNATYSGYGATIE